MASSSAPSQLPEHFLQHREDDDDDEEEKRSAREGYKSTNGARTHRSFRKIPIKLRKHFQHLRFLSSASPAVRKKFIDHAPDSFVNCCSELCMNYCDGRIDCTPAQKTRLTQYKRELRALAKKKTSLRARRKILQHGGILPALALPIISVIGGLIPGLVDWIRGK